MNEHLSAEALTSAREVIDLDHHEAMRLLASVDHGRVIFNHQALPAIRLVNHLIDEGRVIVRTRLTATVSTVVRLSTEAGVVVAYEADDVDPQRRAGWSVVVTGWATTITDPDRIARYEQLLHPWV
ncbi:pyridoxamine 5'-phosphate oxidase family protein, partial [Mycobacterium sp.]|uniref:pyridoxamine 5'-phosphate oxidase family protein n=1 Tax=Mycobacterium sp. TaxID=1785 RepID=UPI003C76E313